MSLTLDKAETTAVAVRPQPIQIHPQPVPAAYKELSHRIQFSPDEMVDKEIHDFLLEQQIPIYNNNEVANYMSALAGRAGKTFCWRPLRKKDEQIYSSASWNGWEGRYIRRRFWLVHEGFYRPKLCPVYDKLVPSHILLDVDTIIKKFGNKVAFFVTDYAAVNPDPFILVTSDRRNGKRYIFGAWDEPGFGVI